MESEDSLSLPADARIMIQVSKLVKNFGLHPVLRGVDLKVKRGEFLTLVGPNGAGKTTLLRIIATLGRPTAGEVRVGGWSLPKMADKVRPNLGFISHQPLIYGELTAEENLRFFASMYGMSDPSDRIKQILEAVGLYGRRNDPAGAFSRGMQQRLAIARAILHQPEVMLLDEPYTGLDQSAAAMLDDVLQSVATAGRTVVMTTHNLERGLAFGDRFFILHRGRLTWQGISAETDAASFGELYNQFTGNADEQGA